MYYIHVLHTAPYSCQPDRLATLRFSASSVVWDSWDSGHCSLSICDYRLSWTNTVSEAKIQITLLILRRGALSSLWLRLEHPCCQTNVLRGLMSSTDLTFVASSFFGDAPSYQDWHKTDLKLTQKSLDVWISLDFHLGPPKTNFGIKKQWFRENRTLTPPPPTQPCLNVFLPIVQTKGKGVKGFFKKTVELVKSVSLIQFH